MRYYKTFDGILGQGSKIKILRVLTETDDVELNGREIARLAKLAPRIVNSSLYSLFRSGIVQMRKSGKSKLYSVSKFKIKGLSL